MADARTEQLAENRHVEMPMNASPTAAFKVVPAKLFLSFTKADFDHCPCESHSQQTSEVPAESARHPVTQEVLHHTAAQVRRDDQRALRANESISDAGFSPTSVPLDLPNLRATMLVTDTITLWCLFSEAGRMASKVSHLVPSGCLP